MQARLAAAARAPLAIERTMRLRCVSLASPFRSVGLLVWLVVVVCGFVAFWALSLTSRGMFLGLVIPAVYMIPCGIVTSARPNSTCSLSPWAGTCSKVVRWQTSSSRLFRRMWSGRVCISPTDMKFARYLKVPPPVCFVAQSIATILAALTQAGVALWMVGNISDICQFDQPGVIFWV